MLTLQILFAAACNYFRNEAPQSSSAI